MGDECTEFTGNRSQERKSSRQESVWWRNAWPSGELVIKQHETLGYDLYFDSVDSKSKVFLCHSGRSSEKWMTIMLWYGCSVLYSSLLTLVGNVFRHFSTLYLQDICSCVWYPHSVRCPHSWCWCCCQYTLCKCKLAWGCHLFCVSRCGTWHLWQQRNSRHHNPLQCPLLWWLEQGLAHRRMRLKRKCSPIKS